MCHSKEELGVIISDLRQLKAMKAEIEAEISSKQSEIMNYLKDSGYDAKQECIGNDFVVKWNTCERSSFSKDKLKEVLGEDLSKFQIVSTYERLYIS